MIPKRRPSNKNKLYVQVYAHHRFDGVINPKYFGLESGERIHIDKVVVSRRAAARKAGGQGTLYVVLGTPEQHEEGSSPPLQHEYHLFYDDPYWFIEVDDD